MLPYGCTFHVYAGTCTPPSASVHLYGQRQEVRQSEAHQLVVQLEEELQVPRPPGGHKDQLAFEADSL